MANSFNTVQVRKPTTNVFDLSHDVKYSMDMGVLTPVFLQEVLPGDVWNVQTETLIRFAPLVAPVMHNIRVFTHYFFVPNRIVYADWEKFISADLSKESPPAWPNVTAPRSANYTYKGTLWDYLGLPVGNVSSTGNFPPVSAVPFAAYQAIWNEFYRDQNLQTPVNYQLTSGTIGGALWTGLNKIRRRAWQHDYFTAALPFAQKGPSVKLPLLDNDVDLEIYRSETTGTGPSSWDDDLGREVIVDNIASSAQGGKLFIPSEDLNLDAVTINDFRVALRLQEFFEKAARGGTRYVEQLKVHFGVQSSDKRLQRPEFLGGTRNPVIISEVLQTSSSDEETPQANMAGHGLSAGSGKRIRYYSEEHGYIIGIQSIMPSTAYQQGIPKHFSRQSWDEYGWPTFVYLGEQPILNKELYVSNDGLNDDTFGYIPRYSEYRYTPSRVAGDFRDELAYWHLGRIFANRPQLNADFIECVPRSDIFAASDFPQKLWCHSFHKSFVRRKLPKYGTPTL